MNLYKVDGLLPSPERLIPAPFTAYITAPRRLEIGMNPYFKTLHSKGFILQTVTRIPLWVNEYVIQEYWGRWEDVNFEDNITDARRSLKEYRENSRTVVRLITRKVINPLVDRESK